ncbi:MAG: sigma-70 family RNA polymerase sigma factor [Eubacteriales bacterium]|nr:sigma-70 family RNA polymerase sigma factor [Eubacteriales bacterium]
MELVKITYRFADGHMEEIEVEPEVAETIRELDRQEYNNTQKETRRHTSLSAMEYEDERFAARNADVLEKTLHRMDAEALRRALPMLTPAQQDLVRRVFFLGERPSDIAEAEGVDKSAITHRLERIYRQLKKSLL